MFDVRHSPVMKVNGEVIILPASSACHVRHTSVMRVKVKEKFYMAISHPEDNLLAQFAGYIVIYTSSNATEAQSADPSCKLAVNHSRLQIMASKTVDQIDWLLPPTLFGAVSLERHKYEWLRLELNTRPPTHEPSSLPIRPLWVDSINEVSCIIRTFVSSSLSGGYSTSM